MAACKQDSALKEQIVCRTRVTGAETWRGKQPCRYVENKREGGKPKSHNCSGRPDIDLVLVVAQAQRSCAFQRVETE